MSQHSHTSHCRVQVNLDDVALCAVPDVDNWACKGLVQDDPAPLVDTGSLLGKVSDWLVRSNLSKSCSESAPIA